MVKLNLVLKGKLIEHFRSQGIAAKMLEMSESRLSRIVTGLSDPRPEELKKFAAALGPDVLKTFPRD
jgi:Helix-turn-helix